jgi:hypothetical protein
VETGPAKVLRILHVKYSVEKLRRYVNLGKPTSKQARHDIAIYSFPGINFGSASKLVDDLELTQIKDESKQEVSRTPFRFGFDQWIQELTDHTARYVAMFSEIDVTHW